MNNNTDLAQAELYINRELSLLEFNRRVLAQSVDEATPILERLRFLCISSTNLDEFFEIRVAGLRQKAALGSVQAGADNMSPQENLKAVSQGAHELVAEQYRILNEELIPRLAQQQIRFIRRTHWSTAQATWLLDYFREQMAPVLSPLGLDPAHPFPRVINKSLNFIVSLKGKDAFGRNSRMAVVQAPRSLPRLIQLPPGEQDNGPHDFVFLSSVIHAHVGELSHGMRVNGCYQFRITRASDLYVDEEEMEDLLRAVEGELPARRFGDAVRIEVADNSPPDVADYLLNIFNLGPDDLYQVAGPVNLNRLIAVYDLCDRPDLKYSAFTPGLPPALRGISGDMFDVLRQCDILLHHPYELFAPVIEFVRQAAADPQVLAIKQTLYRTGPDSAVIDALVAAARAGKEVTVVIELRARFDEEANIRLANRLQEAGAHVVYGIVGYKTHAKMIVVVRREARRLRDYVHLSTGNYHFRTARVYSDYGLFTCDPAIGEDVRAVFTQLTSLGKVPRLNKLLQSPFTLHDALLKAIAGEAERAAAGRRARIIIKVNAITEPQLIQALYRASQAGVRIELIVRGICCLRPGVPGVSERIRVRSIIGRFLEHTRVYCFHNGGDPVVYCSSADWMERNMFRRVEAAFPIEDKALKKRLIQELELYLKDNTQTWLLQADGRYQRLKPKRKAPISAQMTLLATLCEGPEPAINRIPSASQLLPNKLPPDPDRHA